MAFCVSNTVLEVMLESQTTGLIIISCLLCPMQARKQSKGYRFLRRLHFVDTVTYDVNLAEVRIFC
uniref:Uncharacterized protein n=1 Tax=Physcomitrium patens TaxID=3218 RepID=A0A2K1IR12_PHYPA|nr:hypothetical protein PHYPA_025837 [Physcomitrium patens]